MNILIIIIIYSLRSELKVFVYNWIKGRMWPPTNNNQNAYIRRRLAMNTTGVSSYMRLGKRKKEKLGKN